ncbi:hypothetical protein [Aquimarina latercula]|uniref:hypothetical protein n=1 Tax=Aquimarina latercula TaxID=987 RepID=UPI0003FABAD5|nr:hypothetical protein [Aquimarina latercula]
MDQETKSNIALNQLRNKLTNIEDFGDDGYKARCKVTYTVRGKSDTEILEVYLIVGGFEPMIKLDIYELGEIITIDKYHMDFNPRFSNNTKFSYDNDSGILTIDGKNSPKIGNFTVEIEEV